ncbi:MAG: flagellin lysine-N-methylase [Clostridia bacterium]|nr:flagellin lysine-N-methylase [Clostridia bacterium]
MKQYFLNYYPNFKCVAGKCKHTCCAGWEMNIDPDTLAKYKAESTDFGERLKKGINFKKSQFKADKAGRCAFLNDEGLCDIIVNLGEQRLCQVCRDHPRFRSFFDDRTETGLGFCCEEATRIILSFEDKIAPVLDSDDKNDQPLDFNQKNIIDFRQKAIDIVQDRERGASSRTEDLLRLCRAEIGEGEHKKICKVFLSFERLNKGWTARLKSIKDKPLKTHTDKDLALYFEQFLVNGLYRHLYLAEDTFFVRAITTALVVSWWVIQSVYHEENTAGEVDFGLILDIVRAFSAEVEYSQKNLGKLFDFCAKFIKI